MISKEVFAQKVGKKIQHYRRLKEFSQEKLAHECGFYRTYIGHLENARYSPTAYVLWKIASALKVPVEEFYP